MWADPRQIRREIRQGQLLRYISIIFSLFVITTVFISRCIKARFKVFGDVGGFQTVQWKSTNKCSTICSQRCFWQEDGLSLCYRHACGLSFNFKPVFSHVITSAPLLHPQELQFELHLSLVLVLLCKNHLNSCRRRCFWGLTSTCCTRGFIEFDFEYSCYSSTIIKCRTSLNYVWSHWHRVHD